ncbi:MAG: lycopene cyclase family protein [Acidimicrobiia bacterium]
MTVSRRADVAIIGAGPAGLALAAACLERNVDVVVCAPTTAAGWTATYGCWVDEIVALGLERHLGHRWDRVRVVGNAEHELGRPYGVLDNESLRNHLAGTIGEGRFVDDAVTAVSDEGGHGQLTCAAGGTIVARLVVDASGHEPVALQRRAFDVQKRPVQTAYGLAVTFDNAPIAAGTCTLMDWSPASPDPEHRRTPTFLYALDLGDGRFLVEETSLAAAPAMPTDELRSRLVARLERMGVTPSGDRHEEHVWIPMRAPRPLRRQLCVGFGAAAGYVHPATGYSVVTSLQRAQQVGEAIADGLARPLLGRALSSAVWDAIWPRADRRARALHDYGLGALCRFDADQTRAFFDAFFSLPVERWRTYLSGSASSRDLTLMMAALFAKVPIRLRGRLFAGDPRLLARALTG